MGFKLKIEKFDEYLENLRSEYKIYAPVKLKGKGTFADTDAIRYEEIKSIKEVEFNLKSDFSPKEIVLPITQTLFYFTEDDSKNKRWSCWAFFLYCLKVKTPTKNEGTNAIVKNKMISFDFMDIKNLPPGKQTIPLY